MTNDEIRKKLFSLRDEAYRDFQAKLIPTVAAEKIIGVRTPDLRKFAKELFRRGNYGGFLDELPHEYFDENQLHAFLISQITDFDCAITETERFLPFIDNWATSDQLLPKVFKKNKPALLKKIRAWLTAEHTYTVRFAVGLLMQHFLDEDFSPDYLALVSSLRSEAYYINMMVAWYFATALAKQYDAALPFIKENRLAPWTHNKAIQKACESHRITDAQKAELRGMKVKAGRGEWRVNREVR